MVPAARSKHNRHSGKVPEVQRLVPSKRMGERRSIQGAFVRRRGESCDQTTSQPRGGQSSHTRKQETEITRTRLRRCRFRVHLERRTHQSRTEKLAEDTGVLSRGF